MSIKQKLILGVLACMVVVASLVAGLVQAAIGRSLRIAAEEAVAASASALAALQRADVARLDAALLSLSSNPALVEAYRTRDRGRFLAAAAPIFEALRREHDVTHFLVHDPSLAVFVRVHRAPDHGDHTGRSTLARAAETGVHASGLELGRSAFALRVVTPWRVDGQVIGYLELGEELDHLLARLKARTGDDYAVLAVQRAPREQDRDSASGAVHPWSPGDTALVSSTSADAALPRPALPGVAEGPVLLGEVEREGRTRARGVTPLLDAAGRRVGAVVVVRDVTALHRALEKVRSGILLTLAALAAAMMALLAWLLQRLVFARLQRMSAAMEDLGARLAGGEYDVPPPPGAAAKDELGHFEEFFGRFLARVGGRLKELTARR